MRKEGITVEKDYQDRKIKAQFKSADRLKAKYVAVLGEDELANNKINVKNMATGEQVEVALATFIHEFKKLKIKEEHRMFGRTYFCGEVTETAIGEKVMLKGWVNKRRDLGGLIFIDLRDRTGIVQIVFNPDVSAEALEIAEKIRNEYVIEVQGTVIERDEVNNESRILQLVKLKCIVESITIIK